jgi:hypothetical protein
LKLIYKLTTSNIVWSETRIESKNQPLQLIELEEKKDPKLAVVNFSFSGEVSRKESQEIAEQQLNKFIRAMLFKYDMVTYAYYLYRLEHKDHAHGTEIFLTEQVILEDLKHEDLANLSTDMERLQSGPLIELYMAAMKIPDITAKFIFLYSILLQKYPKAQADIDDFILHHVCSSVRRACFTLLIPRCRSSA